MEKHQDQSRNALKKSMEAAFNAWVEELHADQTQFMADKVMRLALKDLKVPFFSGEVLSEYVYSICFSSL